MIGSRRSVGQRSTSCTVYRAASVLAVLATLGCARNAILEVELDLPPLLGATDRYAVVQFESDANADFEDVWQSNTSYPGTLLGAERQTVTYSVVTEDETLPLLMRVSFCVTPDCSDLMDGPDRVPGLWYRFERTHYIGARTRWHATIATMPTDPPTEETFVGKCEVEGCIDALGGDTSFCRLDGRHYCE